VLQHLLDLVNRERRFAAVNDRVAIRAHGPEVTHGIKFVGTADASQGPNMMHVDEVGHGVPVASGEGQPTSRATRSIVSDAQLASTRVALVSVHSDLSLGTLDELATAGDFLRDQRTMQYLPELASGVAMRPEALCGHGELP
jgi:hypothetical protein